MNLEQAAAIASDYLREGRIYSEYGNEIDALERASFIADQYEGPAEYAEIAWSAYQTGAILAAATLAGIATDE